jgi:hypothetical protein
LVRHGRPNREIYPKKQEQGDQDEVEQRKKNADKADAPEDTKLAQCFFDSLKGLEKPNAGGATRRLLPNMGLDSNLNDFHIHHIYYNKAGKS